MSDSDHPFPLPASLPARLAELLSYWEALRRGDNAMPFADDVKLGAVPELADRALLLDVFVHPYRFRLSHMGPAIARATGSSVGTFADEIEPRAPLNYLLAQCSTTVEAQAPTFYGRTATQVSHRYARLLLPLWADGHVATLLGAVEF